MKTTFKGRKVLVDGQEIGTIFGYRENHPRFGVTPESGYGFCPAKTVTTPWPDPTRRDWSYMTDAKRDIAAAVERGQIKVQAP